jgi:hypothetical protein
MRVLAPVGVAIAVLSVATVANIAGAAEAGEAGAPLSLYPRRPGAKYEDVEAAPGQAAKVPFHFLSLSNDSGDVTLRLQSTRLEPETNVPSGWERGSAGDGFVPHPKLPGPVVHLRVDAGSTLFRNGPASGLTCSLTDPTDGAEIVGFVPPWAAHPDPAPSTTTSTTPGASSSQLDAYVPVGSRRGRMYARCAIWMLFGGSSNVVWRVDV